MSQIIYTRNELKTLKEENDRKNHENNVQQLVNQIATNIIKTATHTTKTTYIHSINPLHIEDNKYNIITDAINILKEKFIDVTIEYKTQKDLKTGKEFNHGIYIDWS